MGTRTSYAPGTFSYIELASTDPEAAKQFYSGLFGWSYQDNPLPGGGTYTTAIVGGEGVAGLALMADQQREAGVPPFWFSYVTVASADETASRAEELGGGVHAPPFDVMELGRMAVIADPTGAMFGIWEAKQAIGSARVNDPGCLTMNELGTTDVDAASEFYAQLFGWRFEQLDTGDGPAYWAIHHEGAARGLNGGMRGLAAEQIEAGASPHWLPYFTVSAIDDAVEQTKGAGGAVHFGPTEIPAGQIAVLSDPQHAFFAVFEGDTDD